MALCLLLRWVLQWLNPLPASGAAILVPPLTGEPLAEDILQENAHSDFPQYRSHHTELHSSMRRGEKKKN